MKPFKKFVFGILKILFILVLLLFIWSHFSEQGSLNRELHKKIPNGMNISAARSLVEADSFKCTPSGEKRLSVPDEDGRELFCGKCEKESYSKYECKEIYFTYSNREQTVSDSSLSVRTTLHDIVYHERPLK